MENQEFFLKLQSLDRRWIFLFIALAVIIPLAFQVSLKEPATAEVQDIYDRIQDFEAENGRKARVLLAFDFDPPSEPELLPMAISLCRHLALNGHQMYFMSLWPVGPQEVQNAVEVINEEFEEYTYGATENGYMNLGFRVGGQGVIQNILGDLSSEYTTDAESNALGDIPMMAGIDNLTDFDMILSVSAGGPGSKEWVQFAGDPGNIPISASVTAVSAPQLYPYYPSQLFGLMGGLKAASEYETLLLDNYGRTDEFPEGYDTDDFTAMKRMGPQTVAHIVILLLILVGNIAFFVTRGQGGGGPRLKSLQK
jgi:hypothetical protein